MEEYFNMTADDWFQVHGLLDQFLTGFCILLVGACWGFLIILFRLFKGLQTALLFSYIHMIVGSTFLIIDTPIRFYYWLAT